MKNTTTKATNWKSTSASCARKATEGVATDGQLNALINLMCVYQIKVGFTTLFGEVGKAHAHNKIANILSAKDAGTLKFRKTKLNKNALTAEVQKLKEEALFGETELANKRHNMMVKLISCIKETGGLPLEGCEVERRGSCYMLNGSRSTKAAIKSAVHAYILANIA